MSDGDPPEGYVYAPTMSPSVNARYHTRDCRHVGDGHILKTVTWAERSRLQICRQCDGTSNADRGGM